MDVLAQLLEELAAGRLKIVDLTTPLDPETPVIDLPPMFAPSPGLTLTEISHYDSRGPAWYWNILNLGEHTGTHFDAPIHWVTGKDLPNNATDTIEPRKFIGPACVIDITTEVQQNPDFLLTINRVEQWEATYGRIPKGAWVLIHTGWSQRKGREAFLNVNEDGAHSPGFQLLHARCRQIWHHQPDQPRSVAAHWCNRDCRPPQNSQRLWQPLEGDCDYVNRSDERGRANCISLIIGFALTSFTLHGC